MRDELAVFTVLNIVLNTPKTAWEPRNQKRELFRGFLSDRDQHGRNRKAGGAGRVPANDRFALPPVDHDRSDTCGEPVKQGLRPLTAFFFMVNTMFNTRSTAEMLFIPRLPASVRRGPGDRPVTRLR